MEVREARENEMSARQTGAGAGRKQRQAGSEKHVRKKRLFSVSAENHNRRWKPSDCGRGGWTKRWHGWNEMEGAGGMGCGWGWVVIESVFARMGVGLVS